MIKAKGTAQLALVRAHLCYRSQTVKIEHARGKISINWKTAKLGLKLLPSSLKRAQSSLHGPLKTSWLCAEHAVEDPTVLLPRWCSRGWIFFFVPNPPRHTEVSQLPCCTGVIQTPCSVCIRVFDSLGVLVWHNEIRARGSVRCLCDCAFWISHC